MRSTLLLLSILLVIAAAIRDLFDRGRGRPKQAIEGSGPGGAIPFSVILPGRLVCRRWFCSLCRNCCVRALPCSRFFAWALFLPLWVRAVQRSQKSQKTFH